MHFSRSYSLAVAVLCLISFQFSSPARAHADTYSVVFLDSDQGRFFAGMDDAGHVLLDLPTAAGSVVGCSSSASHCYETFLDGIRLPGFTSTLPAFAFDNGTPCAPSVPAGTTIHSGVCNNGRDAFTGTLSVAQVFSNVYVGSASPFALAITAGGPGYDPVYMNALGDIVFDSVFQENWYIAIDQTSRVTPEPASLVLLATGMLGAGFLFTRRRATT
jgi:hypothetical protein